MDENRIVFLKKCSLLRGLPDEALAALAARTVVTNYAVNQQIFAQGDEGDEMLVVIEGRVKINATSPDGKEIIVNTINAGDIFGELSLIDSEPRSASAVANRASLILRLRRRDLIPVLEKHPDLALSIMRELSRKLRNTTAQYEELVFLSVAGRLARRLAAIAESQADTKSGTVDLILEMTQEEIGQMIGATRERVNQVLHRWQNDGLMEIHGRQIRIFDVEEIIAQCEQ